MLMFFTILLAAVPVMVLSCILFAAAARKEEKVPPATARPMRSAAQPRFFAEEDAESELPNAPSRVAIDAVLSQIERHIRLEQAAAESFLDSPNTETLHSRTTSQFMN